jgi:hypothetical protein
MANSHELAQPRSEGLSEHAEVERLSNLVKSLQEECEKLRQALQKMEAERNQALCANARAAREFVNVDIPSLAAISGGPVEMIE